MGVVNAVVEMQNGRFVAEWGPLNGGAAGVGGTDDVGNWVNLPGWVKEVTVSHAGAIGTSGYDLEGASAADGSDAATLKDAAGTPIDETTSFAADVHRTVREMPKKMRPKLSSAGTGAGVRIRMVGQ